jgi:hypothetical protein
MHDKNSLWRFFMAPGIVVRVLLFFSCLISMSIFAPAMPGDGLDPSWRHGINEAVAREFSFGRDIIFTFGPYGAVYSGIFHPSTDSMMLWSSLGLGLAFGFVSILVARNAHWAWMLLLSAVLTGVVFLRDPLFFCYPYVVGMLCLQMAMSFGTGVAAVGEEGSTENSRGHLVLGVAFAPVGLLMIVKGSNIAQCGVLVFSSAILFASVKRWREFWIVLLSPTLTMLALWLMAGQSLFTIPDYFKGIASVTAGYSEAMSSPGPKGEWRAYLLAAACLLVSVALGQWKGWGYRLYALMTLSATLFVAFKGGFVRHDGHATIAGVTLLLVALFIVVGMRARGILIGLLLSVNAWYQIDQNYMHNTTHSVMQTIINSWTTPYQEARRRMERPELLVQTYDRTLEKIRLTSGLPILSGKVDIYSFNQTQLLASGNLWHPRPAFQSYAAYSPDLLFRNRAHLEADHAPDHIFFRIEPIDDRFPSSEDGPSWPLLLTRYVPQRIDATTLLLSLDRNKPSAPVLLPVSTGTHRLGEVVSLATESRKLMVQLDIRQSLRGRLVNFLYKPSPLWIKVTFEDGGQHSFRLISGMARSGFLLSPLIVNAEEFMALGLSPDAAAGRKIKNFSVAPVDGHWQWQKTFSLKVSELR